MDIKKLFSKAVSLISEEVRKIYKLEIDNKDSVGIRKSIVIKYPSINCYYPIHDLLNNDDKDKIYNFMQKRALKPIKTSVDVLFFDTTEQAEQALEIYYLLLIEKALKGELLFDYFYTVVSKREGTVDLKNSELEFFFFGNGSHIRTAVLELNKYEDFPLLNHEKSVYWK